LNLARHLLNLTATLPHHQAALAGENLPGWLLEELLGERGEAT
jgi:hypothetical protein